MERTIRLLREKNNYLENFFVLNEAELGRFAAGNFDGVEAFYRQRDAILDILRRIDEMLDVENRAANRVCTDEDRAAIEGALAAKEGWVAAILRQDLQILAKIEAEKSAIIRELQGTQKARRAVGGYRSGAPVGRLDEKA